MIASVATVGVVQPILVSGCACQGQYQILAGFRRAYACREIGLPRIQANIYPLDPDQMLSAFLLALYENLAHRRFNDVEKSLILSKLLHQFGCSREELIRHYLPLLQLAPHEKVLEIYVQIQTFDEALKEYIAAHDLPMTVIELLANLSVEDRNAVFGLISTLKIGVNKLKDMLTMLEEIALRDQRQIHAILADSQIQEILTHAAYSGPQKTVLIRKVLRQQRYPQLTDLELQYQDHLKRLGLSKDIQVSTDRFFEDDTLTTSFRFETPEQLQAIAEKLSQLSQKPELQQILTLIQG